MFGNLLNWWRSGSRRSSMVAAEALQVAPERPPATPVSVIDPGIPPWRLVRRRPLIGHTGAIAGWDLQLPASATERIARAGTPRAVRAAHQHALLHSAHHVAQSARIILMAAPGPAIVDSEFLAALPPQTILRLGVDHEAIFGRHLPSVVESLARRHFKVAAMARLPGAMSMLDASRFSDSAALLAAAKALPPARAARVAINLFSFEDLSTLIDEGFSYCCGAFQNQTHRPQRAQLSAPVRSAAAALAAVIADKPSREISALFKADLALSYRLLRTVNSAAFGLSRPADSIHDALVLLGSKELYRWLTALLISAEADRPLAPALYETALTRARLCELLATERRTEPPEALFVTGAFSLLDVLLDVPLEVPLASARLSEFAIEALIGGCGPWRPHLEAALAVESADAGTIEHAAASLGLSPDRVAELADEAAAWAQQAATAISGHPPHAECRPRPTATVVDSPVADSPAVDSPAVDSR